MLSIVCVQSNENIRADVQKNRCPDEIIKYTVLLYHRYSLNLRDIAEILLYRGIEISYETIRAWNNKFSSVLQISVKNVRTSLELAGIWMKSEWLSVEKFIGYGVR